MDGGLFPEIPETELPDYCPFEIAFLHPVAGLSGFEAASAHTLCDLLELPEERVESWNLAVEGGLGLPEFSGIQLVLEISPEEIFGESVSKIGTQAPKDLPPTPDEPFSPSVSKVGQNVRSGVATWLKLLLNRFPTTASKRTWVNDLEDWAEKQIGVSQEALDRMRHKELYRLMDLLKRDPDAGLKHALPLNALPSRGTTPPSGRLGKRSPHFDASRLGGGPADLWSVPDDLLISLRQRYLTLANQALQLGHFQRAAYIHGNLLGDLATAANVLKQGTFFREAALLYEKHLDNPGEAAQCYALAGLVDDALRLWETLRAWREIAELQERLDRPDHALAAWKNWAEILRKRGDLLESGRVFANKLNEPETALSLWLSAWQTTPAEFQPLQEMFSLLGASQRHSDARQHFDRIAAAPQFQNPSHRVLEFLTTLSSNYPEAELRHRAADEALVQMGCMAASRNSIFHDGLHAGELVGKLWPEDQLLRRDCHRFQELKREHGIQEKRKASKTLAPAPSGRTFLSRFSLPAGIRWSKLSRVGTGFQAIGLKQLQLWATRGKWSGESHSLCWSVDDQRPPLAVPCSFSSNAILLGRSKFSHTFEQKPFPAYNSFDTDCIAGTPTWLPNRTLALVTIDGTHRIVHLADGGVLLGEFSQTGNVGPQHELFPDGNIPPDIFELSWSLVAIDSGVALGWGDQLWIERRGQFRRIHVGSAISSLAPTLPHTRPGLVILTQGKAMLLWFDSADKDAEEINPGFEASMATFIPPNYLVFSSAEETCTYTIQQGAANEVTRWKWNNPTIDSIASTSNPFEIAALDVDGQVEIYKL
jgi:tetratricopeptide (TPR) repeat protein